MSIRDMRQRYADGRLEEKDVHEDPWVQFAEWFEAAKSAETPDWFEPNAMTLSTADLAGKVTSRIVLLKGIEGGVMTFFSNYRSLKGSQIEANPQVSLCFYWPHQQRQVRVEGTVTRSSREKSRDYFGTRPRESQIGACASEQSAVVGSRGELEQQIEAWEGRYADAALPCPDHWGGYDVTPTSVEFWQGRPGRVHDRLRYRRDGGEWILERLSP